LFNAHAFSN